MVFHMILTAQNLIIFRTLNDGLASLESRFHFTIVHLIRIGVKFFFKAVSNIGGHASRGRTNHRGKMPLPLFRMKRIFKTQAAFYIDLRKTALIIFVFHGRDKRGKYQF